MMDLDHKVRGALHGPPLGPVVPNVAALLEENEVRYGSTIVFRERREGEFRGPDWRSFVERIRSVCRHLRELGIRRGDRCAIVSPNKLEMLEFELAVMASGAVAVPIFAWYPARVLTELLSFSRPVLVAAGGAAQLSCIDHTLPIEHVVSLDDSSDPRFQSLVPYSRLAAPTSRAKAALAIDADPDSVCLMQFTSGTTGLPKLVQLTHRNMLSQRVALDEIWPDGAGDRILSYLPWHHSFGGGFELFNALARGATITLEPSFGKDPVSILEHWKLVRPTIFFSVPKVYQALIDLTRDDDESRSALLHADLRFVFTAAAALPDFIAKEFDDRGIRVIEGWGLTETAPCCTIGGLDGRRTSGIVGKPIAGVNIRIADDGEIQVTGPNVMRGYFDNDEANAGAFTGDGWFRTGDIGAIEDSGLRLIGRRDRIFKLSNGEKVISSEVEQALQGACHYLSFAVVEGSGQLFPVALLFPNRQLLGACASPQNCTCPKSLEELSSCLSQCLSRANAGIIQKFSRVPFAALIDGDLSIEHGTLTPSMKVVAKNVADVYRATIQDIYASEEPRNGVFVVPLRTDQSEL